MYAEIIVNPTAGRGKAGKSVEHIKRILPTTGFDWNWKFTQSSGDGERLAKTAVEHGAKLIVVVGGDGTLHEVVNGVIGSDSTIGLIPFGTGNDFARSIGVYGSLELACHAITHGDDIYADIGAVTGHGTGGVRHFLVICGTGFDAATARTVNAGVKFLSGPAAYVYGALVTLKNFEPFSLTLTLDGEEPIHTKAMFVSIANASTTGGGMLIAPGAQVDDGSLDVCLVRECSKLTLAYQLTQVFKGAHVRHPAVTMLKAQTIEIDAVPQQPLLIDGEVIGSTPASIQILRHAICLKGFKKAT